MIAAAWIAAGLASVAYGLALKFSEDAARDYAVPFVLVAVVAWVVLASHHNRRHR